MADYSEFPTTPTRWQEQEWLAVSQLDTEDPPPPPARRRVDAVSLVAGLVFLALAVTVMVGASLPLWVFEDGGVVWVLVIAAGIALMVKELRKARGRG
ncbi:hypothetical protein [Blastococcus saxobsidens]|uniref:Uncharacterized protein n=1 Tax=Blastococcus saxobsidens TaxID=138336 RepID=A0A4Q7YAM5_9ACTN|nr:hypothetical protein [Blastococcus saxobsidens]RZU33145.1 hypothetical protein BKA19_2861 [Blastococcus saxobsidens]